MSKTTKITIQGIGSVIIDVEAGTLRPSTFVVAQRLCVGYGSYDTRKLEAARDRTHAIQIQATEQFGQPETGWKWLDDNGSVVYA